MDFVTLTPLFTILLLNCLSRNINLQKMAGKSPLLLDYKMAPKVVLPLFLTFISIM